MKEDEYNLKQPIGIFIYFAFMTFDRESIEPTTENNTETQK